MRNRLQTQKSGRHSPNGLHHIAWLDALAILALRLGRRELEHFAAEILEHRREIDAGSGRDAHVSRRLLEHSMDATHWKGEAGALRLGLRRASAQRGINRAAATAAALLLAFGRLRHVVRLSTTDGAKQTNRLS